MKIEQIEAEMVEVALPKTLVAELNLLASQEKKSFERMTADALLIYKSEKLKRQWMVERADRAIESMHQASIANGNSEMTMDEIDEEIAAARREASVLAKSA